jgi:hypothetical protein
MKLCIKYKKGLVKKYQIDIIKEIYRDMNSEFQNFDLGTSKEQFENSLKAKNEENSKNEIGLGLSISNAILREHGFSFECEKSEDIGTIIKINIKN